MPRLALALAILTLCACGDGSRHPTDGPSGISPAPGSFHTGGAFTPFYGEELFEARIYLFGQEPAWARFLKSHEVEPTKVKTYVGAGPNHETVIVQVDKDAPQMTERLLADFNERHGIR